MEEYVKSVLNMCSFFQYVEKKYPVDQWKINGIHIWPFVRLQMVGACKAHMPKETRTPVWRWREWIGYGKVILHIIKNEIIQGVFDSEHREKIRSADVVLGGDGVGRCLEIPYKGMFDIYLGGIRVSLQKEGFDTFKFECMNDIDYKSPCFDNVFLIDSLILKYVIKRKIFDENICVEVPEYNNMLLDFERWGFDKNIIVLDGIIRGVLLIKNLANEFEGMLKKIKPRIVLVENWRSAHAMAMILAAHLLQIPSVDIQYGRGAGSGEVHMGNFPWVNIPPEGYELMPNYMWVWDQDDYDSVEKWGGDKLIPFIGGQPMNLFWDDSTNEYRKEFQKKYETMFANGKTAILFSLQWNTHYPQWLIDFINETSTRYNWLLRLHPVVDSAQKHFLDDVRVGNWGKWESLAKFPLAILLENVSLQITMNSSTVVEAETVQCPSIVLDYVATKMFSRQIQKGIVRYVENRTELSLAIHDLLTAQDKYKGNKERAKQLYAQGQSGIRRLIEIMETHQPCYTHRDV